MAAAATLLSRDSEHHQIQGHTVERNRETRWMHPGQSGGHDSRLESIRTGSPGGML
jgi:hypothetical protein